MEPEGILVSFMFPFPSISLGLWTYKLFPPVRDATTEKQKPEPFATKLMVRITEMYSVVKTFHRRVVWTRRYGKILSNCNLYWASSSSE